MPLESIEQFDQIARRGPDGRVEFGVGLRITLYFRDAFTPEGRAALLACVADYLGQTADAVTRCSVPWSRSWVPCGPDLVARLEGWVGAASANTPWDLVATGASEDDEASPFHLEVVAAAAWQQKTDDQLSYVTATFPVTWFSAREERMAPLTLKWASRLAPRHGFGGLSFLLPTSRSACARVEGQLYQLALRFPGIELDYPATQLQDVSDRAKGVNWLTVLDDELLARLGGREAVAARLPEGGRLLAYDRGAVIQLGPAPQIGDVVQHNVPGSYAELSRLLKPVRVEPERGWGCAARSGLDRDGTRALLARFEQGPDAAR
jgi:hypothetical protein